MKILFLNDLDTSKKGCNAPRFQESGVGRCSMAQEVVSAGSAWPDSDRRINPTALDSTMGVKSY